MHQCNQMLKLMKRNIACSQRNVISTMTMMKKLENLQKLCLVAVFSNSIWNGMKCSESVVDTMNQSWELHSCTQFWCPSAYIFLGVQVGALISNFGCATS